jgi:hypothetical protein
MSQVGERFHIYMYGFKGYEGFEMHFSVFFFQTGFSALEMFTGSFNYQTFLSKLSSFLYSAIFEKENEKQRAA